MASRNYLEHSMHLPAKQIKKGDYIKRKETAHKVYQANGYCRLNRAYEFTDATDISNAIYIKGDKPVFTGFTY
jgi:hypothetical protein